jgi:PKD repeat protein
MSQMMAVSLLALGVALSSQSPVRPMGSSTAENPVVEFATPGTKTVTLTVCNQFGECSSVNHSVVVLNPYPAVASMSVTPGRVEAGRSVLLDAVGSGAQPLSWSWQILQGGAPVATLSGAHTEWITRGETPGLYQVVLTIANAWGNVVAQGGFSLLPPSVTRYYTVSPCRLLDTRLTRETLVGGGPPLVIAVGGVCGIPVTADAVAANLTAVAPTGPGYVSAYPADQAEGTTSFVSFQTGRTLASSAVLPLSSDGTARLAVAAAVTAAAKVDLLVDVAGYFAVPGGPPAVALAIEARLCAYGFCEIPAGTEVFFSEAFAGAPTEYRYDWMGSGVYTQITTVPVKSHVYPAGSGTVTPKVQVVSGGQVSTAVQTPSILITSGDPTNLPPAPKGVAAVFAGYVTSSVVDPALSGSHPSYRLSVSNGAANYLGYNVYSSKNGAPYSLIAALGPMLSTGDALVVDNFTPPADSLAIELAAVSYAGEGPRSSPLLLTHP